MRFRSQAPLIPSYCLWPHPAVATDQPQWIHSRPTTDCRHQGWAIKDFLILSEMRNICEQSLQGIIFMILHSIKSSILIRDQNLQIFFKSIWKYSQCFGTLARSFHFLSSMFAIAQWRPTRPARVEWLCVNDFQPQLMNAWPNTCLHLETRLPEYGVQIFTVQTPNHWWKWKGRASVPKNGL